MGNIQTYQKIEKKKRKLKKEKENIKEKKIYILLKNN